MANKTAFLEKQVINRFLRRLTTAVSGSNASTSVILVTSGTGFVAGDIVKMTTAGTYHLVTASDATHVTITPAMGSAPTTGNVEAWAYSPGAVWVALFTAAPTDAGGGTEVTGGNYARQQITQVDGNWSAPSGTPSASTNAVAVTFPVPVASAYSAPVTHFVFFDAVTGGNMLGWQALATPKTVNQNDAAPSFSIGALSWQED
jgi:hypothetical protein